MNMNHLLEQLQGGTLISDGAANKVADIVLADPALLDKLVEGLKISDDIIRARTAHALERISRFQPHLLKSLLPDLINLAVNDPVPMVRWHIPMIFSNFEISGTDFEIILSVLFRMLKDNSVFVKNWAVTGLTVFGKKKKFRREEIILNLKALTADPAKSVRSRAAKAIQVLENDSPLPSGWYKSGTDSPPARKPGIFKKST
jgi:HEAT repeat protein